MHYPRVTLKHHIAGPAVAVCPIWFVRDFFESEDVVTVRRRHIVDNPCVDFGEAEELFGSRVYAALFCDGGPWTPHLEDRFGPKVPPETRAMFSAMCPAAIHGFAAEAALNFVCATSEETWHNSPTLRAIVMSQVAAVNLLPLQYPDTEYRDDDGMWWSSGSDIQQGMVDLCKKQDNHAVPSALPHHPTGQETLFSSLAVLACSRKVWTSEQCARVMQWMQALAPDVTTEERLVFAYTHSVQKETGTDTIEPESVPDPVPKPFPYPYSENRTWQCACLHHVVRSRLDFVLGNPGTCRRIMKALITELLECCLNLVTNPSSPSWILLRDIAMALHSYDHTLFHAVLDMVSAEEHALSLSTISEHWVRELGLPLHCMIRSP
jgi:hypothetical protein